MESIKITPEYKKAFKMLKIKEEDNVVLTLFKEGQNEVAMLIFSSRDKSDAYISRECRLVRDNEEVKFAIKMKPSFLVGSCDLNTSEEVGYPVVSEILGYLHFIMENGEAKVLFIDEKFAKPFYNALGKELKKIHKK